MLQTMAKCHRSVVSVDKQASLLILHLDNETQAEIFEIVSYEDIASTEGVIQVLGQMDKSFLKDILSSFSEVRVIKEEPTDYTQQDTLYGKYNKNIVHDTFLLNHKSEDDNIDEHTFCQLQIPNYPQEDVFKIDLDLSIIDNTQKNDYNSHVFSGVSKSVCGMNWLLEYLETLTYKEKLLVKHKEGNCSFQFSHTGLLIPSVQQVSLSHIMINNDYSFEIEVVTENIPLLLAESEVKKVQKTSTSVLSMLNAHFQTQVHK